MESLEFDLPATPDGQDAFHCRFGRVSVILGANGSGKSRLLRRVGPWYPSVPALPVDDPKRFIWVDGGRVLLPPEKHLTAKFMGARDQSQNEVLTLEMAVQAHENGLLNKTDDRLKFAFLRLLYMTELADHETASALRSWETNRQGAPPTSKPSPLKDLFGRFHAVFPEIELRYDASDRSLACARASSAAYLPRGLSDGEKQVLGLLVEIGMLARSDSIVVVDEPELHLHTTLAIRLWDVLEATLPNARFIYATHNVAFAMRASVETVLVLSARKPPLYVDHVHDVPHEELREFLGTAPIALSSDTLLAVEGSDQSFDQSFYRWLIDEPGLTIAAVGDCETVRSVVKGAGVWAELARANVRTAGVVDRDFRDDAECGNLEAEGLNVLPVHEVESLLCNPKLVATLGAKLALQDPVPDEAAILEMIFAHAKDDRLGISMKRVWARARVTLTPSLTRKEMATVSSVDEAANLLAGKVTGTYTDVPWHKPESIAPLLQKELAWLDAAIADRDVAKLLRVVPGKDLLKRLANAVGCDVKKFLNSARKNLDPAQFPELSAVRKRLRERLGLKDP